MFTLEVIVEIGRGVDEAIVQQLQTRPTFFLDLEYLDSLRDDWLIKLCNRMS